MSRSDWDIPAQRFNFRRDLAFGKQGEKLVNSFLKVLDDGAFEVKTDRYRNGRMAVEVMQNPRRAVDNNGEQMWKDSGIIVTKAKWWVYVFTLDRNDGTFVIVPVRRLKKFIKKNSKRLEMRDFAKNSDNPARGYILEPSDVMEMMVSADYDE